MKIIASVILVAMQACASGCTHPDWIERTLVTVDVTGAWKGISHLHAGTGTTVLWLDLRQKGSKITGSVTVEGASRLSGSIEGTIAGDVFTFRESRGDAITGELTVRGDEMTGEVVIQGVYLARITLLQRVEPSSRSDSPPR